MEERLTEQNEGVQNKFVNINDINLCLVKENVSRWAIIGYTHKAYCV